jgi:hypothetical protein
MKKNDVQIGATYLVKVASNLVPVKITREHDSGGWEGTSVKTGKTIRIKTAQRLRKRLADPEHAKAIHKADQENARVRDERAKAEDGMTASERAMAESAPGAKKDAKATKDAKPGPERDTGERGATGAKGETKPMSLLDAAAHLLSLGTGDPMRCKDIVDLAAERGLWKPRDGKTPANTLSAAISREIKVKGEASRFVKAERGKFALAKKGA